MDLTPQEEAFLIHHGFKADGICDGRGLSKERREAKARESEQALILTSVRCRAAGHRIRTRGGHCAQCNPASIGFTKRERSDGIVYIAGSKNGRLIKIGTAKDIDQRERQLRAESYGGCSDWRILVARAVSNAGITERNIAALVPGERVNAPYWKDGDIQTATEIFRCSFEAALTAFEKTLGPISNRDGTLKRCAAYNFP